MFIPGVTAYQKAVVHDELLERFPGLVRASGKGSQLATALFLGHFEDAVLAVKNGERLDVPLSPPG